jgi:hypothetical protein
MRAEYLIRIILLFAHATEHQIVHSKMAREIDAIELAGGLK